ncbi:MAG: cytochrome c [Proteobacteria bacterium]|nr:cytochrome c [Pseudomonadota bacterium]
MKTGWRSALVVGGVAAGLLGITVAEAQMNAMQSIEKRQEAMKGNGGAMRVLTPMARGEAPFNKDAAVQAVTTVNNTAKMIPSLFPQGSGPSAGKTDALPAIWDKWADFQTAAKGLEEASGRLLLVAQAGDEAGFKSQFANVGRACGSCHEPFRAKKP